MSKRNHHKLNTFVCDYCGKTFSRKREKNGETITCSMLCRNKLLGLRLKGVYPTHLEQYRGLMAGWNKGKKWKKETRKRISRGLRKSSIKKMKNAKEAPRKAYRKYALMVNEHKCSKCGWEKVPSILMVHHIDGNRENNAMDNLQILCPNCHFELHHWDKANKYRKLYKEEEIAV